MSQRIIEVFTAGCPVCDEVVARIRAAACPSCDVRVLSMHDEEVVSMAAAYGVERLPSVVVEGELADCCQIAGVDMERLEELGLGRERPTS